MDKVITGRINNIRAQKNMIFLELRKSLYSVQCVLFKKQSLELFERVRQISQETVVSIEGTMVDVEHTINSVSERHREIHIRDLTVLSSPVEQLPFQLADADMSLVNEEFSKVGQNLRLNNRFYDLRSKTSQAIFRLNSRVEQIMRKFLYRADFTEIHTPKLIGTATEGGSSVFAVDYFGRKAYLTQSPQLYKQMAIAGDLERVFEVGPVFRAENAATHRHLCQFTGFDLEMEIESYDQVLDLAENLVNYLVYELFEEANFKDRQALDVLQESFHFEKPILKVDCGEEASENKSDESKRESKREKEGDIEVSQNDMLRIPYYRGVELINAEIEKSSLELPILSYNSDLGTPHEKLLGKIVKEQYGVDFFILSYFPLCLRPFYTQPVPLEQVEQLMPHISEEAKEVDYSYSFDLIFQGEEISSGARRVNCPKLLETRCVDLGLNKELLKDYLDCFKLGMPMHGGFGIGMERLIMLLFNLKNVRRVSMFPRDGERLGP